MATSRTAEAHAVCERMVASLGAPARQLASGLGGDRRTLERLAAYPRLLEAADRHRVAPLLAGLAATEGVTGSCTEPWERAHQTAAAATEKAARERDLAAVVLRRAGVSWMPAGDLDLIEPFADPWPRAGAHLHLLVPQEHLPSARQAFTDAGWKAPHLGTGHEAALNAEGATWRAAGPAGSSLALAFRGPWWLPERWSRTALERARPVAERGPGALRPSQQDAYILAALGFWLAPPPRPLLHLWDLHRIAGDGDRALADAIHHQARRDGLQLPVGAAAALAGGLWPHPVHHFVALLLTDLPRWERSALRLLTLRGVERAGLTTLNLGRLLSGRDLRLGWRGLLRRVWAHPGVVADDSPDGVPAFLRRPRHALLRLFRPASDLDAWSATND